MHGGVMCEGHSCLKSSLMRHGRTHKYTQGHNHTYKWAKYACEGVTRLSSGEMCLFVSPSFAVTYTITPAEQPLAPRLSCFLCICTPSQARLILIFMSWAWRAYYYYHYCYYAFQGREIILGRVEAEHKQGLSLLQSSDWSDLWFMQTTYCLR